ncbi:hypothetical protein [Pseudonocardia alaniniphila]|uniref:Uncharacterized protein n=1 Tax=Pseudonocardia alaniniphila TaxID=75291 RepID=A0ABS9TAJ7_9PSEU|nr:hypothetical protein [Pseudonocardia alaniniphila]MCH6165321.1 hypothetical protein [Pseudonocardia alaniniphila]
MPFIDFTWVGFVCLIALMAACSESVMTFLDVHLTSWSLRLQGVPPKDIRKIAIAKAKKPRRNVVLQVLDRLINFLIEIARIFRGRK